MVVLGPIGPWTAYATCSEGQVVSRGGLRGGRGEGWHQCVVGQLSPLALSANGSTGSDSMCSWYMSPDQ